MNYLKPNPEFYNLPFSSSDFNGMPYRSLGHSGLKVSNCGLGTWKFGYPETGDGARVNEKDGLKILDVAIEEGVTFWDTANRYNSSSGNSERIIGNWINKNQDQRRNVVIATKLFGGMDGKTPNHSGLSRANILDSVYASLARMQLDYIDLLYFHGFDENVPIIESLTCVEDLVSQGLIRYFAVSNFTSEQLGAYQKIEDKLSVRCRITAVQNQFDVLYNEKESHSGVLDYCVENGISFVAYSPIRGGLITNRYLDKSNIGKGDRLFDEGVAEKELNGNNLAKLNELNEIAKKIDLEINELVLAYMLTLPGMGPIIPAASNIAQLKSNAKTGKIKLNEDVLGQIKKIL
ncbi:MAG: aryl-alcohol dehydrogenase [Planctomycetota bacterium]|nr:MAG: aryl-alcohol dehydrogenase [Planctomycetota bacterium]